MKQITQGHTKRATKNGAIASRKNMGFINTKTKMNPTNIAATDPKT
jgi:hypothetical protein